METIEKDGVEAIETWLLTQCYLKTLKRDLPDTWKVPRWFTWHYKPVSIDKASALSDTFWKHLFKSEILMNYFGLEVSFKQASHYRHPPGAEYFYDDEILKREGQRHRYRTKSAFINANLSIARTIYNLREKGLVDVEKAHPNASKITLTEKGRSMATLH